MPSRPPSLKRPGAGAKRQWKGNRTSASARGYGSDWSKRRARIMARDKRLCQAHLKAGRMVAATDVDHITPRHLGGTDDDTNLQALCAACHRAKTAREGRARRDASA